MTKSTNLRCCIVLEPTAVDEIPLQTLPHAMTTHVPWVLVGAHEFRVLFYSLLNV